MGNEVSQAEGVKQSVGGEGQKGQFHRVLVESEYSVPDFKSSLTDINSDTVTSGEKNKEFNELKSGSTTKLNTAVFQTPGGEDNKTQLDGSEYSLIEECKALITEAADRAVQRSISHKGTHEQVTDLDDIQTNETVEEVEVIDQAKSVSILNVEPPKPGPSHDFTYSEIPAENEVKPQEITVERVEKENAVPVKTGHVDKNYALKCGIIPDTVEDIFNSYKIQDKGKKQREKSDENVFQRDIVESVKQHFDIEDNLEKEEPLSEAKPAKGGLIAKMFKFSKRKPKAAESDVPVNVTIQGRGIEEEGVPDDNVNVHESQVGVVNTGENQTNDKISQLRRLNSLDSGIVVDKSNEQSNNNFVEYAVVQKIKPKAVSKTEVVGSVKESTKEINEIVSKVNDHGNSVEITNVNVYEDKQADYVNGDKIDEDYVYVNERAVDVDGLVVPSNTAGVETLQPEGNTVIDRTRERLTSEDERLSNISTDSGASSGPTIQRSDVARPDKAKLKKKSWSFQLMGRKNKSEESESGSVVSMDPNPSHTETKKFKWRFGKFSFRKDSDGVSTSTPNLHEAGIPEGEEVKMRKKPDEKKKLKLKNLKSKKDKKKGRNSLDSRSISMINIGTVEHMQPRSRRSIVEEDLPYTQPDVIEGVSLSDLSQDEDAEVSTNPKGKAHYEKKQKGKKVPTPSPRKQTDLEVKDEVAKHINKTDNTTTDIQAEPSELKQDSSETNGKIGDVSVTKAEAIVSKAVNMPANSSIPLSNNYALAETEDEYVNIISAETNVVESSVPENIKTIVEDSECAEYAQVVKKKKPVQDLDKNIEKIKSTIPDQVLKLGTAQIVNMEDKKDLKSRDIVVTEKISEENTEEIKESNVETVQKTNEKAFSNLIYSDEEFNASIASLKKASTEQEDESDAYVELQEIADNRNVKEDKTIETVENNQSSSVDVDKDTDRIVEVNADEIEHTGKVEAASEEIDNDTVKDTIVGQKLNESESIQVSHKGEDITTEELIVPEKIERNKSMPVSEHIQNIVTEDTVLAKKIDKTESIPIPQNIENTNAEDFTIAEKTDKVQSTSVTSYSENIAAEEIIVAEKIDRNKSIPQPQVNLNRRSEETVIAKAIGKSVQMEQGATDSETFTNMESDETIFAKKGEAAESMQIEQGVTESESFTKETGSGLQKQVRNVEETARSVTKTDKVIVMKDVGVQVPDIYMPLDKDKDFSYNTSNARCVSVGIQVTNEVNIEHVVVSLNTVDDSKEEDELSPAFF